MEDLVQRLGGRLLFAVPKKGRLQQPTLDLLAGSDIQFKREHRLDIALVKNLDIALVFLPAADIPTFVGEGRVDLGITGRDQVAEYECGSTADGGVEEVLDLGFGACKLQVQIPEAGKFSDVKSLVGGRIATSFMGLTTKYFREQESQESGHDSSTDKPLRTKLRNLGGSVETACTLGVADGIVDLVESGETMRAAGLKAIATIIESTAILIKSKHTTNISLINLIAARIRGITNAQRYVLCQYNISRALLPQASRITPGKRAPTVTALEPPHRESASTEGNADEPPSNEPVQDWVAVSSMVLRKNMAVVMDDLTKIGATDILCLQIMNSRTD